ncbi:hypothetical protein L1887_36374 [Cichorium endivia]|nr:hypothetical protein L1887_36374 [Cichorium endivia]
MSSSRVIPEKFFIPLEEILRATENFSRKIGVGGFGSVYAGNLSERWQNRTAAFKRLDVQANVKPKQEFHKMIEMMSKFNHENIISFIGYCDEANEMIEVFQYSSKGSLDGCLHEPQGRRRLKWRQRLKICLGIARGLEYLHSGLENNRRVLHGDMKSANILLDDYMEAKISDFDLSLLVDRNQPLVADKDKTCGEGTKFYIDPIYEESGILNTESDVYSFGVILFEMLTGMLSYVERDIGDNAQPQRLINLVRRYAHDDRKLVDTSIKEQVDTRSYLVFREIAYQCISWNLKDRPMMNMIIKRLQEAVDFQIQGQDSKDNTTRSYQPQNVDILRFPLEEIITATENFSTSYYRDPIYGESGIVNPELDVYAFGVVMLEILSGTLASKPRRNQDDQARTLTQLIRRYYHDDGADILIDPLINDQINMHSFHVFAKIAYRCISYNLKDRPTMKRIINGIEEALEIQERTHVEQGAGSMVLTPSLQHQDLESFRISLKDINYTPDWEHCIGDGGFGKVYKGQLSKGTLFYLDPAYQEGGILSKESDVYSFGVVLFEMLCGTLAYNPTTFVDGSPQYPIILVRRYCNNEPKKLIDPYIRDEVDNQCFETFKEVAYQCINLKPEERPTMDTIIDQLQDAIYFQEHKA